MTATPAGLATKATPAKLELKAFKPYPYPFSTCVVCGMKLDDHAVTLVQGDYEVKFCSQTDADEFKRNPDAYLAKVQQAYRDAKPNPLTTCAVCGMDVDAGFLPFVYEGRQFQVCDKDCLAEFQKDPAKYVKIWDDAAKTTKVFQKLNLSFGVRLFRAPVLAGISQNSPLCCLHPPSLLARLGT